MKHRNVNKSVAELKRKHRGFYTDASTNGVRSGRKPIRRIKKSKRNLKNVIIKRTGMRNVKSIRRPSKNLIVDLNLFPDRPIEAGDI